MMGDHRLAHAALEVGDRNPHRASGRALWHQGLPTKTQPAAQLIDLIQGEPALTSVLFHDPLRQGGIIRQLFAKRVRRDVKHELTDFPD